MLKIIAQFYAEHFGIGFGPCVNRLVYKVDL